MATAHRVGCSILHGIHLTSGVRSAVSSAEAWHKRTCTHLGYSGLGRLRGKETGPLRTPSLPFYPSTKSSGVSPPPSSPPSSFSKFPSPLLQTSTCIRDLRVGWGQHVSSWDFETVKCQGQQPSSQSSPSSPDRYTHKHPLELKKMWGDPQAPCETKSWCSVATETYK